MIHLAVIFFVSLVLWSEKSAAFTRSHRRVPILSNDSVLYWDLALESASKFVTRICTSNCADLEHTLSNELESQLEKQRSEFYVLYLGNVNKDERFKWLQYTDSVTQSTYFESFLEVDNLRNGIFLPRSYCNNKNNVVNEKACLFFQLCQEYRVLGAKLTESELMDNLSDNLYALSTFAERLFNAQWYDHSEALTVYVMFGLIPRLPVNRIPPSIHLDILHTFLRLSMILCEIEKLRGNMEGSAIFALTSIQTIRKLSKLTENKYDENKSLLHMLRLLLTTPSIPSDTTISAHYRQEIEEDLSLFLEMIRREKLTVPLQYLTDEVSATPFYMAHQGLNDKTLQVLLQQILGTLCPAFSFHAPHVSQPPSIPRSLLSRALPVEEIRLGFISSHFFDHSIGRILVELMRMMSKFTFQYQQRNTLIRWKVYVYFLDMGYSIETGKSTFHDEVTGMLEQSDSLTFTRLPIAIPFARQRIAQDSLDILIYADLGMDFTSYVLAYSRLARYQIAWWGHPITSGIPTIDYFFSLDDELSEAHDHYSEQLVRMQYINSVPLRKPFEHNQTEKERIFQALELPANARVAVSLGRLFKFHPDLLSLFVDVLWHVENQSRVHSLDVSNVFVVFFVEKLVDFNEIVMGRLEQLIQVKLEQERSPTNNMQITATELLRHLKIVSYREYYHTLTPYARVVLDTYPYGGCITTHDALHMNTPVLTMPSTFIRGRFTLSMYHQMNHTDLIAADRTSFITKAYDLLLNDSYYQTQASAVREGFSQRLLQNSEVALEWTTFLLRAIQQ